MKIWIFDDPFHKKRTNISHLVAREDPKIRSIIFSWNEVLIVIEATEAVGSIENIEDFILTLLLHHFFDLTSFYRLGQKYKDIFIHFLVQMKT